MHSICRIAALLTALILMPAAHASGASIYKWVDDEGVTHYTQQPPPDRETQLITPNAAGSAPQESEQSSQDKRQTEASGSGDGSEGEDNDGPQDMAEFCNQTRERIATLESSDPVSVRQPDDTLKRLSDEERAQQLERARGQLQQHCSGNGGNSSSGGG